MLLRLVHPGRAATGPLEAAAQEYRGRVARHLKTDERFVRAEKADRPDALEREGARLLELVGPRDRLVALDPHGAPWASEELARRLDRWTQGSYRAIIITLGSAHGLHDSVVERADERWSLGPLTLPHDLARVVVWEQLYRAGTILRGEPYHK